MPHGHRGKRRPKKHMEKRSGDGDVDTGQQDKSTAGGRWRRQHRTEMDGEE